MKLLIPYKSILFKRNKKIAIITTPIVCAVIAFIILLNTVIIPNGKYNDAIALMNAGNVVEAYEALVALDGYKDSADKANSIYYKYKVEKLKVAKVGDHVFFGAYEQDNNTSNGEEECDACKDSANCRASTKWTATCDACKTMTAHGFLLKKENQDLENQDPGFR